ncbi:hypothetical protein [Streptomyces sp. NPDC001056]
MDITAADLILGEEISADPHPFRPAWHCHDESASPRAWDPFDAV